MYYTYILENLKSKLYIGYTYNLDHRLFQHNTGAVKSTRGKGPWKIIYTKKFTTKIEAYKFEKYLKSLKNSKYMKKRIICSQLAA